MKRLPVPQAFVTRNHLLDDVFRAKKRHQLRQIVGIMLPSVQFSAAKAITSSW